jgi:hypothetical protein
MRQRKAPTKNQLAQRVQQQSDALDKRVENTEMASRISQMLIQQIGNSMSQVSADVRELANRQRDLQYRLLAVQELTGLDTDKINSIAEEKQVKDFMDLSNKENEEKGYTAGDTINEDSIVVFTTKTANADRGILRSKLALSEISLPDFRSALLEKKAGDTFQTQIQNKDHEVTVLEVWQKPEQNEPEQNEPEQNEPEQNEPEQA